eukprot:CAMPEP_0181398570 /NCGR_PEP_ID=MMETSP1110-20121109/1110_1 /TAXON_ID=174948 /ORGANISM="Symbiodinium sp., Strain CCMP421" /LENGTH=122 /DNA_ID=CAMNT_0023520527 /DNA_START=232 /DNA_END=597 /DNA_ORIENTATION=-
MVAKAVHHIHAELHVTPRNQRVQIVHVDGHCYLHPTSANKHIHRASDLVIQYLFQVNEVNTVPILQQEQYITGPQLFLLQSTESTTSIPVDVLLVLLQESYPSQLVEGFEKEGCLACAAHHR